MEGIISAVFLGHLTPLQISLATRMEALDTGNVYAIHSGRH